MTKQQEQVYKVAAILAAAMMPSHHQIMVDVDFETDEGLDYVREYAVEMAMKMHDDIITKVPYRV